MLNIPHIPLSTSVSACLRARTRTKVPINHTTKVADPLNLRQQTIIIMACLPRPEHGKTLDARVSDWSHMR